MYGVKRGKTILCHGGAMKLFRPNDALWEPVIFYNAIDVDNYVQELMVKLSDYSLEVCKFTEEQLQEFSFQKLKGY